MVDMAMSFIQQVGKQPVLCKKDVAGFIVNRVFIPLVHEAGVLPGQGQRYNDADRLGREIQDVVSDGDIRAGRLYWP